jgi:glycosyltransferase involved in cell wall biosynthesis
MTVNREYFLVSIIMPVFNGALYIGDAMQSVVAQVYPHWELLIINDGSIDNTEAIILARPDSRIKYFKQANKGVSAARNVGLENASGDLVCFLDVDDILTPNSLSDRLAVIKSNPSLKFVDGIVYLSGPSIENITRVWAPSLQGCPKPELLHLKDTCFVTGSWMIRRDVIGDVRFREGLSHSEDLLFLIEISKHYEYGYTNTPILYFRRTGASAMSNLNGLALGYLNVYSILSKSNLFDSIFDRYFFKMKMIRIMFLSYLSNGDFFKAFSFIIKGLFA